MRLLSLVPHRHIYTLGLSLIALGLPLSRVAISIGIITIAVNWLLEGNFRIKLQRLRSNSIALVLLSLFGLHLAGLLITTDLDYAMHDLRIKIPLLVIPFILSTIPAMDERSFRLIWIVFIAAVEASGTYSLFAHYAMEPETGNGRELVPFVSHIRYALMVCMVFAFMIHHYRKVSAIWKIAFWINSVFLLWILAVIQSATGFVVLGGLVLFSAYYGWSRVRSARTKAILLAGAVILLVVPAVFIGSILQEQYTPKEDLSALEYQTSRGGTYAHDMENGQLENGYYVWKYIAWEELEEAWTQRSDVGFHAMDAKNQPVYGTLIRYLTSKGSRKDADAVDALTDEEIRTIESGIPSILFAEGGTIRQRLTEIAFESNTYLSGSNPSGHSVTQRLEFWRVGWAIFKQHPIIGVGTGDVQQAYDAQYAALNSQLEKSVQLRAHNQYLTFLITFGLIGCIWFLAVIFVPLRKLENRDFFYLSFVLILGLSFISEDTLETQAGVTFYAFFNALLLFGRGVKPHQVDNPPLPAEQ